MIKNTPMCCVSVGLECLLLLLKDGTKLLDLLQRAVRCEMTYPYDRFLVSREALRLELQVVSTDKIKFPEETTKPGRGKPALPDLRGR